MWEEKVDDYFYVDPTKHVETPELTTTTETTTPSNPNENGQKSKILENKLPGLPEGFDIRDLVFG